MRAVSTSRGVWLRLILPVDARLELSRQALEECRSVDGQAEVLLTRLLRRASERRAKRTEVIPPAS